MKTHLTTRSRKRILCAPSLALAAALALVGCSSGGGGAAPTAGATSDSANGNVSIMVGGLNKQIYLPFKLAEGLGYYKEQGSTSLCPTSRPASTPQRT